MKDLTYINKLGDFLLKNQIKKGETKGFIRRYRSIFSRGSPYPEITGYLLTSFSRLYEITGDKKYLNSAILGAESLIKFQNKNGSIPTIISENGKVDRIVHVFDLGIIARGLIDLYLRTKNKKFLKSAEMIIEFLDFNFVRGEFGSVLDVNGNPFNHNFPKLFWINMKLIIPMYQLSNILNDKKYLLSADLLYKKMIQSLNDNYLFGDNNYLPYNRSHYHAYALYGMIFYHKITKDEGVLDLINKGTESLLRLMDRNGGVFYEFNLDGNPIVNSGYDVPVSAQLAEIIFYINCIQKKSQIDVGVLNKLESFLINNTYNYYWHKKISGGLPFIKKSRIFPYAVPWGVEFFINYYYDKFVYKIQD